MLEAMKTVRTGDVMFIDTLTREFVADGLVDSDFGKNLPEINSECRDGLRAPTLGDLCTRVAGIKQ